jgi:hypothetical protein
MVPDDPDKHMIYYDLRTIFGPALLTMLAGKGVGK